MKFSDIPIRENSVVVMDAAWFNSLRAAGIALETLFGLGYIPQTDIAITNNQTVWTDITNMLVDGTSYSSMRIDYEIIRSTSTTKLFEKSEFQLLFKNGTWEKHDSMIYGDNGGLTFNLNQIGNIVQVQYKSSSLGGTGYTGFIKYKGFTFSI